MPLTACFELPIIMGYPLSSIDSIISGWKAPKQCPQVVLIIPRRGANFLIGFILKMLAVHTLRSYGGLSA